MQKRIRFAWLCAALLVFTAHAQEQAPAPAKVELDVMGTLTIDAQGAVSDYEAAPSVPAAVASAVKGAVRHWRFEPIVKEGKPVIAKTQMFLFLVGEPGEGGGYRLRVERVQFGFPRKIKDFNPARQKMPDSAVRQGVGGEVLLAVHIDAAGNVLDATALRSRLVPAPSNARIARKMRSAYEQMFVESMKKSTFEPADPAQGGGATSMITNMSVSTGKGPIVASVWTQDDVAVTSTGTPAWLDSLQDGALDRVGSGQQIALDGGPKLLTDVVGKPL